MAEIVYKRGAPPWPFATISRAVARAFPLYSGVDPLNLGAHEGLGYLLVMTPFDAALTLDIPRPPMPFGCIDRRTPGYFTSQGRAETIYPACTGNVSRSSAADDLPASTYVPGKLSPAFNFESSLFSGSDPTQGGNGEANVGILELIDPDGELDDLRTLGWDGAPLELRRGGLDDYFSAFETVAKLTTAGLRYNNRKKEILLRDLAWSLIQAELHGERYLGTGGIDGDASLTGRLKPYCIGSVFNITPALINATLLIYQVSCSSVLAIDAVRDGGAAALTNDGDVATYALLESTTVSSGHVLTCKSLGLFKIGATPVYVCTADVRGDNDTVNGTTYPHTRAQIARRIATGRGNIRLRDPFDIDVAKFSALDQWQTATLGYYWGLDEESSKAEALNKVMAGCAGWWQMGLAGQLAIGQLEDPGVSAATLFLDYAPDDGTTESRVDESSMNDDQPPRRNTRMGWSRNYTVMQTTQIAGSVTPANRAIYQAASRYTTSQNLWVASGYPSAKVITVDGGFSLEDDAQREGDRQSRIFAQVREVHAIPVVMDPFAPVVGIVVNVRNANRGGLGASKNGFCFGVAVNANAKPILKLWV